MPGFFSSLFGGTPARQEQVPRFTPEQQGLLNSLLQQAQGRLQQQPRSTEDILAPVFAQGRKRFQEQTIPQLLEQFQAGGGLGSGRLQSALAGAAGNLESQFSALQSQAELGREGQQQQQLSQLLGLSLQPQFETVERPREAGLLEHGAAGLTGGLSSNLGLLLPLLLGGAGSAASGGISGILSILNLLGGNK